MGSLLVVRQFSWITAWCRSLAPRFTDPACHDEVMPEKKRREEVLKEAWIGDAVLCLYARQKILREDGRLDGEKYARMTSNRFLASIGEASEIEAGIGRIFERDGLKAAYLHIEQKLMPVFERQEQNYLKRSTDRSAGVTSLRPRPDGRRPHAIV